MDLTNLFMNLPKKGIEIADIRQLIFLNIDEYDVRKVIETLDYWCCKWKGVRFPTALRIVYGHENMKIVAALPFLDTSIPEDRLLGVEFNGLVVHKKAFPQVELVR